MLKSFSIGSKYTRHKFHIYFTFIVLAWIIFKKLCQLFSYKLNFSAMLPISYIYYKPLFIMHQSIPPAPSPPPPPRANPRELAFFFSWMANSRGLEHLSCQMPGGGDESRGRMPRPRIVLIPVFIFVRCNRSQSCSSKEMKRVLRPNSRFLEFEGRKMT